MPKRGKDKRIRTLRHCSSTVQLKALTIDAEKLRYMSGILLGFVCGLTLSTSVRQLAFRASPELCQTYQIPLQ